MTLPEATSSTSSSPCLPVVRLFADRVLITRTDGLSQRVEERLVPLVELGFDYGGTLLRARDERPRVFQATHGDMVAVERDAATELQARCTLERLGAVELGCLDNVAPPDGCDADYVVHVEGDEHAFCAFTVAALDQWRAHDWRVEIDADYPFRVVEPKSSWYARVEPLSDRPDWFALELGVDVAGERVDLLPVLVSLIEDLDGGLQGLATSFRSTWALRANGTHHVAVSHEQLLVLVRVVSELYQGTRLGQPIPSVRGAALVTLDDQFANQGTRIRWTDPGRVVDKTRSRLRPSLRIEPPEGLCANLRPYQAEGVAFLQHLRESGGGGVLADEMGLGKTLQTIAHILIEKVEGRLDAPALVVAPTTLVVNWAREIGRFAPSLRVVILHGADRRSRWGDVPHAHVVITTYPLLVRDEELFAKQHFHLVVLDEAQNVKNARSQARRALEGLSAAHRLCLTGTPVENHLGELWSLFDWLVPGLLGDELAFRRFWRQPIEGSGDSERLIALRELVTPHVIRRLKKDVARELPPKTELAVPIDLEGKQRELYEAIRVAAHADVRRAIRVKGLAASTVTILDALTKLRQVCCDPRLIPMQTARSVCGSAKLDVLIGMLDEQLSTGHRVLVFSQFATMLGLVADELGQRGVRHLVLTGATRDRQRMVDDFEAGKADVFLISLKAGGTGINLTSADTVIHYDPWWNPAAQAQATDRAYRIGQRRPVFVHNLYVAGSVEERVLELQQKKRWLSTGLLGDAGQSATLGEGDIDSLFAPLHQ